MTSRKRQATGQAAAAAAEHEQELAAANSRVLELETQLDALQTQQAALLSLNASIQAELTAAILCAVDKDKSLDEALRPVELTDAQVIVQLDQLAELASIGLSAFSGDPCRAQRPDLDTLDLYTNAKFLAVATSSPAELDCVDCGLFHRFVHQTLARARSKLRTMRRRSRHKDAPEEAGVHLWRSERAEANILQYALEFVNPQFCSAASYIIGLNVRCMTKSAIAVDLLGRFLPGGTSSATFQRHLAELVELMDDSKLDIPLSATAIFAYDNNSDNYINSHARCAATLKADDGSTVFTNRELILFQQRDLLSSQLNPDNSVARLVRARPVATCSPDIFFFGRGAARRPSGAPSDEAVYRSALLNSCEDVLQEIRPLLALDTSAARTFTGAYLDNTSCSSTSCSSEEAATSLEPLEVMYSIELRCFLFSDVCRVILGAATTRTAVRATKRCEARESSRNCACMARWCAQNCSVQGAFMQWRAMDRCTSFRLISAASTSGVRAQVVLRRPSSAAVTARKIS
mmetsp:Transcript_20384/g.45378  ORF Transcript_20384/g.45378 Transcript_20384/m.45378 type:complete len:519 (+) Transcript_20384:85-1641(+)